MQKLALISGAIFGMLGVAIGAFGAHGLKAMLEANGRMDTFETAVKYQMYHALALLAVGILQQYFPGKLLNISTYGFVLGILIFSGSLYVLSLSGIRWLGAVTPIGGVAFIIGWACMALAFWRGGQFN